MTAEIDPADAARLAGAADRYRAAQALTDAERTVLDQTLLDVARRSRATVSVLGAAVGMHPNAVRAALRRAAGPTPTAFDQPELDLGRAVLLERWESMVRPWLFAHARTAEHPMGVLVGGQPVAGKTRTVDRTQAEHDVLVIPSDGLKRFFPGYRRLVAEDPVRMTEVTNPAMDAWRMMALDEAVERRVSLVMETTLRRADMAASIARKMRDGG